MRVLILGGTVFLGRHLVDAALDRGDEVTIFHRGRTGAPLPTGVRHVHAAAPDLPILDYPDELRAPAPDVVLHMILLGERDAAATMAAFGGVARRIVAVSSADVYRAFSRFVRKEPGLPDPVSITEESPLRDRRYPFRC